MSKEKALKLINEYLAKQEPIKVELNLINKIEKADDVARASEKGLSKIAQRLEQKQEQLKTIMILLQIYVIKHYQWLKN